MAIDSGRTEEFRLKDENVRLRNLIPQLMIASQNPNVTPETDLEAFQNQGGYAPEKETKTPSSLTNRQKGKNVKKGDEAQRRAEESRGGEQQRPEDIWPNYPRMIQGMPPEINPEEHKRQQKQQKIRGIAEEGATEGERQAGRGKLKDQTQLPKFFKAIIDAKPSPADLLKILQFLPAFTGGGLGQMAELPASSRIRGRLKGFTKGLKEYDQEGGGFIDNIPAPLKIQLLKDAMAQLPANNIRRLQPDHQTVLDDNNPGKLKIIKTFKPPRA